MSSRHRDEPRRYRRRILTIAAIALGLTFVVGAPFYVSSVESDLEERMPEELAEAGFVGITATFDGQDGTLSCERPLADPEAARQAAYDVWGVRAIDLDRSCRVNSDEATDDTVVVDGAAPSTTAPATDDTSADTAPSTTVESAPAFDTLQAALSGSPQLSLFAVLAQESQLADELADPTAEPTTLFAPTDEAFESLPTDVLADLRDDPDALLAVMLHHMTDGRLLSADFETGPIGMRDGDLLELVADVPSIGGAEMSLVDVEAATGVVHIIDSFPVLTDVVVADDPVIAPVTATYGNGAIELSGTVATEAVRATLRDAIGTADGVVVTDVVAVDSSTGLDAETTEDLVVLLVAMRDHLSEGTVGFDGEVLFIAGTAPTEFAKAAAVVAAESVGVEAEIVVPPPLATVDDAAALEAELNATVTESPILFESDAATVTFGSAAVIEQLAGLIGQSEGLVITVQGHTDSDGAAQRNQVLSEARAFAVLESLELGVPEAAIAFEGFGSSQPVLVNGVEDKPASRRVEFVVVVAP